MSFYTRTRREYLVTANGATPTAGSTARLKIDPQPRHLSRVTFLISATTSTTPGWTQDKDGLDGIIANVKCFVNDSVAGRRTAVNVQGSSLIQWGVRKGVGMDRYTKAALASNAAGTFYLRVPVFFEDPTLPDSIAPKTAIPLYDSGDRPKIAEPVEFELTMGATGFNSTSGTVTINSIVARCEFLEGIGPQVPYVPTILEQRDWKFVASGVPDEFLVHRDGYLGSLFFEGYDNAALSECGDPLSSNASVIIKQDNTDLDTFAVISGVGEDDEYNPDASYTASASTKIRALVGPHIMRDFLHTSPGTNGTVPFSMPKVWADASQVRVTATGVDTEGGFKITEHRFLAADIALLAGI